MKRPRSLCVAQNADIRLGNTRNLGKLLKQVLLRLLWE
jgi:hypothetical protein